MGVFAMKNKKNFTKLLLLIALILIAFQFCGCKKEFSKYEYNEARMISIQSTLYLRVTKQESIKDYTKYIYCKKLEAKFVNDYENDCYYIYVRYTDYSGEQSERIIDITT